MPCVTITPYYAVVRPCCLTGAYIYIPLLAWLSDIFHIVDHSTLPFHSWSWPFSPYWLEFLDDLIFSSSWRSFELFLVSWIPIDNCMGPSVVCILQCVQPNSNFCFWYFVIKSFTPLHSTSELPHFGFPHTMIFLTWIFPQPSLSCKFWSGYSIYSGVWGLLIHLLFCPVSWGCRIHWLLLCRGVRTPQ